MPLHSSLTAEWQTALQSISVPNVIPQNQVKRRTRDLAMALLQDHMEVLPTRAIDRDDRYCCLVIIHMLQFWPGPEPLVTLGLAPSLNAARTMLTRIEAHYAKDLQAAGVSAVPPARQEELDIKQKLQAAMNSGQSPWVLIPAGQWPRTQKNRLRRLTEEHAPTSKGLKKVKNQCGVYEIEHSAASAVVAAL